MKNQEEYQLTCIGHVAAQVISRSTTAVVTGSASQGIYLQPEDDLTLYITGKEYCSPLTLNIRGNTASLLAVQPGEKVTFLDGQIKFPDSYLLIPMENPRLWKPALTTSSQKSASSSIHQLGSRVVKLRPEHPHLALLEIVTSGDLVPGVSFPGIEKSIRLLTRSWDAGQIPDIIAAMKSLLGAGPGLTPLGDDLILGVLLANSRDQEQNNPSGEGIQRYQEVITAAEQKTTSISWSLLHCANQGTADERILRVLDGLLTGREISDQDLINLLEWGSSSGIAVLAGMMMVLSP